MLITSNVFNRIDWSINGVECCTGCYIQNINLGFVKTNFMNKPDFLPGIRFNQYDNSDEGFGTGWNLNLSCVKSINDRRLLRLGNGAVYWIKEQSQPVPASGRTLELEEKYCNTFYCIEYPDNRISVFYKNGIREEIQGGKLSTVLYPNGYSIYFHYEGDDLILIYDRVKGTLLSVNYDRKNVDVIVVSVTNQRRTDYYYLNKNKSGIYELNSVLTNPGAGKETLSLYSFQYQVYENNYLLITSMTSMQEHNRKENIRYEELSRPSGLYNVIKGVFENDIYTGSSVDDKFTTVRYETINNLNFLGAGGGGVTQWQSEKDNLFLLTNYKISRKITSGNQITSIIYNNDYLAAKKTISPTGPDTDENKIITVYDYIREYPGDKKKLWPSFFLPVSIKEYAENNKLSGMPAIQYYRYDKYGNVLENLDCMGIKTVFTYYDGRNGYQDKCPPDPFGFDNYLKEKVIIPAGNNMPYTKSSVYSYRRLSNCSLIVVKNKEVEIKYNNDDRKSINEIRDYYYFDENSNAVNVLMSGALKEEKISLFKGAGNEEQTESTISRIYQYTVNSGRKIIYYSMGVLSGGVSCDKVTEEYTNYYTGDIEEEKKENGKNIKYTFDKFGRKKEVISFYSDKNNVIRCIYTYDDKKGTVNKVSSDKSNITNTVVYSRRGNVLFERIKVSKYESFVRKSCTYDSRDRIIKEVIYDYSFDKNGKKRVLICEENKKYKWNYNDDVIMLSGSNLIKRNISYDYIRRVKTVEESKGKSVRFKMNVSGQVHEKITYLRKRNSLRRRAEIYEFNGFGMCSIKTIVKNGKVKSQTYFSYNENGRVSEEKITADDHFRTQKYSYDERFIDNKLTKRYLNNRLIEDNKYDMLGRVISKEKNQFIQTITYNPKSSSSHPESIKTGLGKEWKYIRTSDDKIKEIALITSSQPHSRWNQSFNYNNNTGQLLREVAFCESDNTEGYVLNELYVYSDYNSRRKEIDYSLYKGRSSCIEYLSSEYKFSSEGRLISAGNDEYSEIYQYNKSSGNINSIWYVIGGKVRCFCKPEYDKSNRIINISLYTYIAKSDDERNNSFLYARLIYNYHYNSRGDVNKTEISSYNMRPESSGGGRRIYREQLGTLIFNYDVDDRIIMTKLNLFSPPGKGRHYEKRSERNYKELYYFNGFDELNDCKYSGDLTLTNNMGRILSGQSRKYNEDGLLILSTQRFSSGISDIISYDYNDKSSRLSSLTHCPFKAGWPETEKYAWNKDGMLISRTRSDGYKEEYEYGGEQNVARMIITDPDAGKTIKTFIYDTHGHQVIQIIQSPPVYPGGPDVFRQINDIYNNDQLMIRRIYEQKLVDTSVAATETHYYHWFQNQVISVSVRDKTGDIKTYFNFNRPDGTTVCRFSPIKKSRHLGLGIFDYYFKMQWIAQDKQGLFYRNENIEFHQTFSGLTLTPPQV